MSNTLTLNEAQKVLNLTYTQVRYLKNKGILKEVPSLGNTTKVSRESVMAYKKTLKTKTNV